MSTQRDAVRADNSNGEGKVAMSKSISVASIPRAERLVKRLYTTAEAATMLGYSTHTVTRMCRAGTIRALNMGGDDRAAWRVPEGELKRLLGETAATVIGIDLDELADRIVARLAERLGGAR